MLAPTEAELTSGSPDIVLMLTDQERAAPTYESAALRAWRGRALVARRWMAERGVTFERHYTGATACAPSRATLLTGQYPDVHGVTQTDGLGKRAGDRRMRWLRPDEVPTMAHWLRPLGYECLYVGKWHVSHEDLPSAGGALATNDAAGALHPDAIRAYERADRLAPFGFTGWIGPEPHGPAVADSGLVRDRLFADRAVALLADRDRRRRAGDADAQRPLLLVVSFVNPHDIVLWPRWARRDPLAPDPDDPPPVHEAPTARERLLDKPAVQAAFREIYPGLYGPPGLIRLSYERRAARYRRTYMRLHLEVDRHIARVRDAVLRSSAADRTLFVLTSDHGELLGAHGGLHQKWLNLYDEAVRVPLVVARTGASGPHGVRVTQQPTSHVDLLPTLIAWAGGDPTALALELSGRHHEVHALPGRDLSGLIAGREAEDPGSAVYVMTRDAIADGDDGLNVLGRLVGARRPRGPTRAPRLAWVATSVEALVARVDEKHGGEGHLWKLVRTFDDPATWSAPGEREGPRTHPLRDAWELYDLDADPTEAVNHAHDQRRAALRVLLEARLDELRRERVPARARAWPYAYAAPPRVPPGGAMPRPQRASRHLTLEAPLDVVWRALADLGRLARWYDEVDHSALISERSSGPGAARRVQRRGWVWVERVTRWDEGRALAYELEGLPRPLRAASAEWSLDAEGPARTRVTLRLEASLGAPIAGALARPILRHVMRRRAGALLDSLAAFISPA